MTIRATRDLVRPYFWTLIAVVAAAAIAACGGTDTGNPQGGDTDVGSSGDAGNAVGCEFERWTGPDATKQVYGCDGEVNGTEWECDCDGTSTTATANSCEDAMKDACGLADLEPTFCERDIGTCWENGDPDGYDCRCDGETTVTAGTSDSCNDLLFTTCGAPCSTGWGQCSPTSTADVYDCACDYFGGGERLVGASSCEDAVRRCNPTLYPCANWAGYCDGTDTGFSCACLDGTTASPTYDSLGHDDCEQILDATCPDIAPPAEYACSVGAAQCVRTDPAADTFNCSCSGPGSAGGETIQAADCAAALAASGCQ